MRHSSTSSSDGWPRRGGGWRSFALITALALLGAEAALRFPEVRALLPPRTHFYHSFIATRLDGLERLTRVHGRVDILFVGSSIVTTNVHPLLFDTLVGGESGSLVSFNAGVPGIWPSSVHLYLEHVWLPVARPRIVVQGVRFAELAATTHAKHETQVWTGRVEAAWRDTDFITRGYAAVVRNVHLLQYRGTWNSTLDRYRNGRVGGAANDDLGSAFRGYEPRPAGLRDIRQWEEDLPNHGTCDVGACRVGFEALRRTNAVTRAAGAAYVLLNIPEHEMRWLGPGAADRYLAYLAALREFAAAEGVPLIDPTAGRLGTIDSALYSDFSHMTAEGSRQFTRAVASQIGPLVAATLRGQPGELLTVANQ
jgi:hypothetical protein